MKLFKTSLLIVAAIGVAASANADLLYSQPNTSADGPFSDAFSTNGNQFWTQTIADDFTVTAPGWNITTVRFWGSSENFFGPPDLTNFSDWEVNIMNPLGTVVSGAIIPKAGFTITPTGGSNSGGGVEYEFELSTNINLAPGTYYLNIGSINVNPQDDGWAWSTSTTGNGEIFFDFFDGNGFQSFTTNQPNMAFELEGTAVPEPATMAALGLGVAAMLRRRRK